MKVLVLSPYPGEVIPKLRAAGDAVFAMADKLDVAMLERLEIDWIVSYGYRYIIREPILNRWPGRVINLHVSLLPFNRGSDPNFWSWFDATPKGVTIHQVDHGLDTGPILAQREVSFSGSETLETSYWRLRTEMMALFEHSWDTIRRGTAVPRPQAGQGTCHRQSDKAPFFDQLPAGYATPVRQVIDMGAAQKAAGTHLPAG